MTITTWILQTPVMQDGHRCSCFVACARDSEHFLYFKSYGSQHNRLCARMRIQINEDTHLPYLYQSGVA